MLPSPAVTRRRTVGLAVLMLSASLLMQGCRGDADAAAKDAEKAPEAVPVEAVAAAPRAIAASYSGSATLEARAEAQVVSKTSGVALQVLVEEGDAVRAGQVLVRIDADRARLNLAQVDAQMRKLEANFRRASQLVDQQMVSVGDHDQLRYDLENARAAWRLAQLELSYTNVVAPISGVIASRSIKTGNFVQINTPILRIVDNSRLEATLNVPERDLTTLRAGLPVRMQVDALPGRTFEGVVARIAPVIEAGSGTFRVVCAFDPDDSALQPGMFARMGIDYDNRANALAIPRTALLEDEGDPAVFVVRDGKAVRTTIETGYVEGAFVEVRKGLDAGDRVVTAGKVTLRDGSAVQVIGDPPTVVATAATEAGAKADGQTR
ncbi:MULTISPECIES: efflux RND transporter periplasmic adaptor subunit [unclassified Luteimonas]|uniref:efflux RND transporter periplasmic adaptor subunit n=1 Tax=unclassified Luteimonas TaxID=2629088 RepID=UPI0018F07322|nr:MULTISPECIES: efflux RND transporter periplasmic adaptor subunit [unclassified Luteimonas]MBJ6980513.1 efflux RND transporter periplasmic adaptor subunit [Luteimonas sp. MC1572]MBJ7574223.1 efflux RND transporter periplasmic adaptor subunit [Luteimonas sp. MC1828]QQO04389.1 efflux RND transporter periplasmic adaptor subunit [Luteimonas sp. MC1572]